MPDPLGDPNVQRLLQLPVHAVVGLNRPDAPPQLTVVWFLWDGESFRFSTTRDRAKYANLKRDESLSLLVDDFDNKFYVVAYGRAKIIEDGHDELAKPLLDKYQPDRAPTPHDPARVIVKLFPDKMLVGR